MTTTESLHNGCLPVSGYRDATGDPGDWPTFPRQLPPAVEQQVYAHVGAAWELLAPYRTADGPHQAYNEVAANLLLFMHTVQHGDAHTVAVALEMMLEGGRKVASEMGPEGEHWQEWGEQ